MPTALTPTTDTLLTDPFLQNPGADAVSVVWFTEFAGTAHTVVYGVEGQTTSVMAKTVQLSRMREDKASKLPSLALEETVFRPIWRHEARLSGLTPGIRQPYRVISTREDGALITSAEFSLAPAPPTGQSLKILLTSDHQLMPMTAANLQKVGETVEQVDGVFLAGDLVNVPDRASEWFDDVRGGAFFPCLQGRANFTLERDGKTTTYTGAPIIQNAPLFPAIGNHEVMGRYTATTPLNDQFNDPIPWAAANKLYQSYADDFNPNNTPSVKQQWLKNNSFNIDTYEEIFSLPTLKRADGGETKRYYATSFGDVRLISLYVTQIWRAPSLTPNTRGRYREKQSSNDNPTQWGYGQHIFEAIHQGSPQYEWLKAELASDAFQQAKYKVVMLHHPPHTLGGNIVPAFTNPVRVFDRNADGAVTAVRYEYPKAQDYIIRDLIPLLEDAQVDLVFYGHSHLWNRFVGATGMHFLESSNVGNSYGAHQAGNPRKVPQSLGAYTEDYVAEGDPNGLQPAVPTLALPKNDQGQPAPYIASNNLTAFSILDTGSGTVSSYYFDTRQPETAVVKFDEFKL
ncbi:MAG: metallophosphoesterase [Cyanobacteria bacterium J06632_22]